jgi:Fe-S-cluster-containing hydrogenase component 2
VAGPEGVEVLELLRSVLDFIRSNAKAAYKERIEKSYRDRTLALALKNIGLFAGLPPEGLEFVKPRVELVTFAPDTTIYAEGDPADAIYLVRLGFVKVSQKAPGGDVVLAYVGPGQHFGETGVVGDGARAATVRALDHVELIRIGKADFQELVARYPAVGKAVEAARARVRREEARREDGGRRELPLGFLLEKGVMNAQNILAIDLDKCTRCDECVRACADAHGGVTRLIRDGLRLDRFLVATACRACTDPVCMIGCPVGSIRRRDSLQIVIEDWCIGCGKCAQQCPYGNIHMHPYTKRMKVQAEEGGKTVVRRELAVVNSGKGRAATCDLCGGDKEPRCVYACPHGAARRGHPLEVLGGPLAAGREVLG